MSGSATLSDDLHLDPNQIDPLAPLKRRHSGSEWVQSNLKHRGITVSPLGLRVADMLGEWVGGIYHIDDAVFSKSSVWDQRTFVKICLAEGCVSFSTVDANYLTRLVFLAHDYGLRVSISPLTFRHFELHFHQRTVREGDFSERHPTLEQALEAHRANYPVPEATQ